MALVELDEDVDERVGPARVAEIPPGSGLVEIEAEEDFPEPTLGQRLAGLGRGLKRGLRISGAMLRGMPSALRMDALAARLKEAKQELEALDRLPDASRTDLPVQMTGMPGMRERRRAQLIKQLQEDEALQRDIVHAFRDYQRKIAEAGQGSITFTDAIEGKGGFLEWLGESIGQGAAYLVPLVAAGAVPAVGPLLAAGGVVALNRADIVGQRAEDRTMYGLPGLGRPAAIEQAMEDPARLTEKIGREQGAIGAATLGYSALDFFLGPVGSVIGRRMGRRAAQEALAQMSRSQVVIDVLKRSGVQSLEEYINEGGQEAISLLMEAALDGEDLVTAENARRLLNAAMAGAASGGAVGGAMRAGEAALARRRPREAVEFGEEAAAVARAAGPQSSIDISQLRAVTTPEGKTFYETPSGDRITKEQWDNAGRRMREAWLTPPAAEPEAPTQEAPTQEAQPERRAEDVEEIEAAPPPKSERVLELERLAAEAETAEARKALLAQARKQAATEEEQFRREQEADDLMRLAERTEDEQIAADLRRRALKLRGIEEKPEREKPAARGIKAREEEVEHVEAKPVPEPSPEDVNRAVEQAVEAEAIEPDLLVNVPRREGEVSEEEKPKQAKRAKRQKDTAITRSQSPLLAGLQAAGGIKESELPDLGLEKKTGVKVKQQFFTKKGKFVTRWVDQRDEYRVGSQSLFRKDGKLDMDGVALWMSERGYLPNASDHEPARELLRRELERPGSVVPMDLNVDDYWAQVGEREAEERERRFIMDEARALGIETEGRSYEEIRRVVGDALDRDWTRQTGIPIEEIDNVLLVRRAVQIDEDAVHDAAVRFEDDDEGFLKAVREIIDAHEKRETDRRSQVAEPAAGPPARGRAAGEGEQEAAAPAGGVQAPVRREQRAGTAQPQRAAAAGQEPARAERAEETGALRKAREGERPTAGEYQQDLFGERRATDDSPQEHVRNVTQLVANGELDPDGPLPAGTKLLSEVRTRRVGAVPIGVTEITTPAEAAHAFAALRRYPREYFAVIAVDADNKPIAYWQGFAGTVNQSTIYQREIAAFLSAVPDVSGYWIAHNHPSGNPTPSTADDILTSALSALTKDVFQLRGHVVIAGSRFTDVLTNSRGNIPPRARVYKLPIVERVYKRVAPSGLAEIVNQRDAARAMAESLPNTEGVLLLDNKNRPIGHAPYPITDGPERLRPSGAARQLMRLIARSNAANVILSVRDARSFARSERAKNIAKLFAALDVRVYDAVGSRGDSFVSDVGGSMFGGGEPSEFLKIDGEAKELADRLAKPVVPQTAAAKGAKPATGALAQAERNLRARLNEPSLTLWHADPTDRAALGQKQVLANTIAEGIFGDLARNLGLDLKIKWFAQENGPQIDGFSPSYEPDAIYINVRSKSPALSAVAHEFLHWLKKNHPDDYAYFARSVVRALRNVPEHRKALNEKYKSLGAEPLSVEAAFEELLADIWGDAFSDPRFYEELARIDPVGFRSFAQKILDFLARLIALIREKPRAEQFVADLRAAQRAIAETLSRMRERGAAERELTQRIQAAQEQFSVPEQQAQGPPQSRRVTQEDLEAAGADARKMAEHKEKVDAAIREFLGQRAFSWMEQNSLLRPTWSWDDDSQLARDRDVRGYYTERDGQPRVVLYYDRVTDVSRIPELLLHEIGAHFGLRRMLGDEQYKTLLDQIRDLKRSGEPTFVQAWERVKRDYIDSRGRPYFEEGSDQFVEEVAAAVIEGYPKDSFVRRLLAQIRAWVAQNISPRLAGKLDDVLLKGLAVSALRKTGAGEISTRPSLTPERDMADVMMARDGRPPPPRSVATTHASVIAKAVDFFNRQFIDSFSQLKKRQLETVRGELADALNTYAREQLMHGRMTERIRDIGTDYLAPIIKIAGEAELTRDDISDGLYALHAPEVNRFIAARNPNMPDAGSGMTDAIAKRILDSFTPQQRKALDKIDAIVQKMNRAKLDMMVEEGLITPADRAAMLARYRHWVSLRQMTDEEYFGFSGDAGLSVRGSGLKARMGRYSMAEDPLSMTVRDAMYAIARAEKNRVAQTFYRFVLAHPNPSLWEEVTPENYPERRVIDPRTGQVTVVPDPVALWRDPEYFGVRVEGQQKWIRIKDKLLAQQMKRLGDHGLDSDNELMHAVVHGLNAATRLLSRLYTQLSVDFALVNPIRDVQQGVLVASSFDTKRGKQLAWRMFKKLPGSLRDAAIANFSEGLLGKHPTGLYEQFRQDGGTTGGFGLEDARSIQAEMERAIAALNGDKRAKAAMTARALLKPIMALNDSFENMSRFAVYKAALEMGFTREQAAVMAKNVTVNFNKRGQASPVLNALWAFFNASVQANVVAVRAVIRSRLVRLACAALFAAGVANALLDEEDEFGLDKSERVSEFVADRNLTLHIKGKEVLKAPLAYGLNIPYATGRHLVRVLQGKESVAHMLGAILKLGMTTFLPTDSLVPTVAQPIAHVVTGEDFAGRRIAKENPFDNVTPKSSQYRENANPAAVAFFKALNEATGGTEFTRGLIDVSPEKGAYLLKQYLGGLAAPLEIVSLPFAEKATVADVPVVRRFVAQAPEDIYITKASQLIRKADARRKEIEAGAQALPNEEEYVYTLQMYDGALRRLSAARNRMLREDKKADVSAIDAARNQLASEVLAAAKAFRQEAR